MNAGKELDALIAEKVMGWTKAEISNEYGKILVLGNPKLKEKDWIMMPAEYNPYLPYSTDISAAWEVVEKLSKTNTMVGTRTFNNQPWQSMCLILKSLNHEAYKNDFEQDFTQWITATGESIPHAICLAALKAVGHEI